MMPLPTLLIEVLFEDSDFIIVNKPSGIPSHKTVDLRRANLFDLVQKQFAIKDLHLPHRLDVGTSGVVLFCKNKQLNKKVDALFKERKIQKTYWALTKTRSPDKNWTIEIYMKSLIQNYKEVMVKTKSGGDYSLTHFQFLQNLRNLNLDFNLIQARPKTGRKHQIRLHMKLSGCPIFGDELYNDKYNPNQGRLRLHAYQIEFIHPLSGTLISVKSEIQFDDFAKTIK